MAVKTKLDSSWDRNGEQFFTDTLNSIATRDAIEIAAKTVTYFRGVDFYKYVTGNIASIHKQHSLLLEKLTITEDMDIRNKATTLGQFLIGEKFIVKLDHAPLNIDQSQIPVHLRDNPKWPRRVRVSREQDFVESGFYAINYEPTNAYSLALLVGTISLVLLFCLFPVWPFAAKIVTYYIGVVLMTLLLICSVIRLILYAFMWFCGYDFWFLPNLFDEDSGIIESFIPLYTHQKRNDDLLMICVRVFAAILTIASFYKLQETHAFNDLGTAGVGAFLDILEWGHTKLGGNSTELTTQNNVDVLLTPEERRDRQWELCVRHCEFQDTKEFMDFCITDCHCLNELWQSRCWRQCDFEIQDELKQKIYECRQTNHPVIQTIPDEL